MALATSAPKTPLSFNDFYREAWPAYSALAHGKLLSFLQLGPAYGGSLVLRAPVALVPRIWGGGLREVYFASGIPCMVALAAFCAWLGLQPARRGRLSWARRINPLFCCAFNPLVMAALFLGHPEEILGAVLCVAGIALGAKGRPGWAGLLIGLAVVNKSWALVAVPVLLVVVGRNRARAFLVFAATGAALALPLAAGSSHGFSPSAYGSQIGTIFAPPELLWWFGPHSWIVRSARVTIVLVAIVCAVSWKVRHARRPGTQLLDGLLLLALVLLLRAALDPWNNLYYHVPFLFAAIAYEVGSGRAPLMSLTYSFILLVVVGGAIHMSYDLRSAMYGAVVLPVIAWLVNRLYIRRDLSGDGRIPADNTTLAATYLAEPAPS